MTNKSGRKLKSWLNQHFKDQQAGEENKKPFSLKAISEKILALEKKDKTIVEFCLRDYENDIDASGRKIQGFEDLRKRMAENKGQMMAIIDEGTRMISNRHSFMEGNKDFNPYPYKIEKIGVIDAPFIVESKEGKIIINFKKLIKRGDEPGWANRVWAKSENIQIFYPGNAGILISSTVGNDKVNKLYRKEAERIQILLGLIKYELYDAVMALKESEKKKEIIKLMEWNGLVTKEELIEEINSKQSELCLNFLSDRKDQEKELKDLGEYVETHIPNSKGVIVPKEKPEKTVAEPPEQKPTLIEIKKK